MQSEISKQTGLVLNFKCYKDNKRTQSTAQQTHTRAPTHTKWKCLRLSQRDCDRDGKIAK